MVADASALSRMMRDYNDEGKGNRELVTRDLLGGSKAVLGSAEVDLELRVPLGWERGLDLLSGSTYLRKNDGNPTPRPGHSHGLALASRPPLFLSPVAAPSRRIPSAYQSVCTLEKVRSALQRAEREERPGPAALGFSSSPSSSITTSSSFKRRTTDEDVIVLDSRPKREAAAAATMVVGCPACHLYVLVTVAAPRCPRCAMHVPVNSELEKRPMFDLNYPVQDFD